MWSIAKLAGADVLRRQRRHSLPETLFEAQTLSHKCWPWDKSTLVRASPRVCGTALVLASTADCSCRVEDPQIVLTLLALAARQLQKTTLLE